MRRFRGSVLVLVAALGCVGCGEDVAPATFVDKLRVLAVMSTPPDLAPGETAVLHTLTVDPSRPGKKNTLIWLA
ncbi:MAG: hypothetical protein ACJ790_14260, partial [Myxococcaceae bacterium]